MTPSPWHDGLRLDDGPLDRQHQDLLSLMTEIVAVSARDGAAAAAPVMTNLYQRCEQHFADEEAFMAAVAYPHREEHRREHARLLRHLQALLGPTCATTTTAAVMDCVRSLVLMHILNDDLEIRHHLRGAP